VFPPQRLGRFVGSRGTLRKRRWHLGTSARHSNRSSGTVPRRPRGTPGCPGCTGRPTLLRAHQGVSDADATPSTGDDRGDAFEAPFADYLAGHGRRAEARWERMLRRHPRWRLFRAHSTDVNSSCAYRRSRGRNEQPLRSSPRPDPRGLPVWRDASCASPAGGMTRKRERR
jgi:hypothetical protein